LLLERPIETAGLVLRSLEPAHARGGYAAWMRDPAVTRYLEVRFAPPDPAGLEVFIATMNASEDNLLLGLFPRAEPRLHIGNIKLGPIDRRHGAAPLGVLIGDRGWRGKRLATQAIAAVCEHAFSALGLQRVEAGFYADNVASQRAFRSAGFADEGRLRAARAFEGARTDEILMARLKEPR
jgi:ribosomal-protein-alanine N-acetyltransferase